MRPFLVLFMIYAGMLIFLIAGHDSILLPGSLGLFAVLMLGNLLGNSFARSHYLEIGFHKGYFYMRSAYDIAYQKNLRFYPLPYANASKDASVIYVNYIDQIVKLPAEDWENWEDLWQVFSYS